MGQVGGEVSLNHANQFLVAAKSQGNDWTVIGKKIVDVTGVVAVETADNSKCAVPATTQSIRCGLINLLKRVVLWGKWEKLLLARQGQRSWTKD
jgi:hypothetical protein